MPGLNTADASASEARVKVFQATDLDSAIELAQRFKDEGRYQWFRGQVQRWPAHSSLLRLRLRQPDDWEAAYKPRLYRFQHWLSITPGLHELAQDGDAVFAIAQHHGIPTDLIDFTTDPAVAGFFSADTKDTVAPGTVSCIYCLDPADLAGVWKEDQHWRAELESEVLPDIHFITPAVKNLWRMEAQAGTFLECGMNWEVVYPMDRIEFPHSGYPSYPTRDRIYPERRSQLELLLDQFFDNEEKLESTARLAAMFRELKSKGAPVHWVADEAPPQHFLAESFRAGGIDVHPSWARRSSWLGVAHEKHHEVQLRQISLALDLTQEPAALRRKAAAGLALALKRHTDARRHAVQWVVTASPSAQPAPTPAGLQEGLDRLWDGMRSQAFDDTQLALAMATWIALCASGYGQSHGARDAELAAALFGPVIKLEFQSADGASSRAYAAESSLRAALRSDLDDWLADAAKEQAQELRLLLQMCYAPERLFDFDKLLALFVAEIGPTQLNRSEPYFFHPARLQILGLP